MAKLKAYLIVGPGVDEQNEGPGVFCDVWVQVGADSADALHRFHARSPGIRWREGTPQVLGDVGVVRAWVANMRARELTGNRKK